MKNSILAFSLTCLALTVACGGGTPKAQEPEGASKGPIGGECKADADCSPGLSCDTGDPGGQCEKKCDTNADCGSGAVCNDEKKCYRACHADAECRAGYACQGDAPNKFCDVANEGKGAGEK